MIAPVVFNKTRQVNKPMKKVEITLSPTSPSVLNDTWGSLYSKYYTFEHLNVWIVRYHCQQNLDLHLIHPQSDSVCLSLMDVIPILNSSKNRWRHLPSTFQVSNQCDVWVRQRAGYEYRYVVVEIKNQWLLDKFENEGFNSSLFFKAHWGSDLKSAFSALFQKRFDSFFSDFERESDLLKKPFIHTIISEWIYVLLQAMMNQSESVSAPISKAEEAQIQHIKNYLAEHLYKGIPTIEQLAKYSGMGTTKFKNLFKVVFGESVHKHLLRMRVEKAKQLFDSGSEQPSEVCYMVGFSQLSTFSKTFKSFYNMSPRQYVNSIKHNYEADKTRY